MSWKLAQRKAPAAALYCTGSWGVPSRPVM